jgi:heptosyltransferase-2
MMPLSLAQNILVIRPDEIGDVVLTGPFLRELRRSAPFAHITLMLKKQCCELMEHCPYVDEVYSVDFKYTPHSRKQLFSLVAFTLRLGFARFPWRGFDLVLLPRHGDDLYHSQLVAHLLAGAGIILCSSNAEVNPIPESRSSVTHEDSSGGSQHEVLQNLKFLRRCKALHTTNSCLELWLTDSDREFARGRLPAKNRYVAFGPGAADPMRRWPIERFAAVATRLRDLYGIVPIVLGAPGDPEFADAMNLVGQTTLRQAAAVLEHCKLFVGNDSGPKHLAAAMGVPVAEVSAFRAGGDLQHNNSPHRFHAWGVPHRVVQPPPGSGALAIEQVTTEQVFRACAQLLKFSMSKLEEHAPNTAGS